MKINYPVHHCADLLRTATELVKNEERLDNYDVARFSQTESFLPKTPENKGGKC